MTMRTSAHTRCTPGAGLAADAQNVRAAGFDGIELSIPKLAAYLATHSERQLAGELAGLSVTMIDVLMPVERGGRRYQQELSAECGRWAALAGRLGCPAVQVVALNEFPGTSWREQRAALVGSLRRLADRAGRHGVRLGIEPVCFSPFRTLEQAREILELVGAERAGLVLDTWHLWVTGTRWEDVAELGAHEIVTVQVGDCGPRRGAAWSDEDRTELPGDGLVPVGAALAAILRTGYRGFWSAEMAGGRWQDPAALYRDLHERLRVCLRSAPAGARTAHGHEETRTAHGHQEKGRS